MKAISVTQDMRYSWPHKRLHSRETDTGTTRPLLPAFLSLFSPNWLLLLDMAQISHCLQVSVTLKF